MLDEHVKTIEKQREEQIESLKLIENEIKELKQLENLYPAIDLYDTAADNWYIYIFERQITRRKDGVWTQSQFGWSLKL